jgi:hypothetical protein
MFVDYIRVADTELHKFDGAGYFWFFKISIYKK